MALTYFFLVVDGLDDPGRVTVILNLSHLPQNYFPGRFNVTTARITVPNAPFTALIFRGTHPHFSTGFGKYSQDITLDSELRYKPAGGMELPVLPEGTPYCRIVAVGYPKECLARPTRRTINRNLFQEQAVHTFGTRRAHLEWRMRMFLKEQFKDLPEGTEPADLCEALRITDEEGEDHAPREYIAQTVWGWAGVEDTEWKEALAAAGLISIGKKFTDPVTGGQVKSAVEVWTDLDGIAEVKPSGGTGATAAFNPRDGESLRKKFISKKASGTPTKANGEVFASQHAETENKKAVSKTKTSGTTTKAGSTVVEPADGGTEKKKAASKRKASGATTQTSGRKKAKKDDDEGA